MENLGDLSKLLNAGLQLPVLIALESARTAAANPVNTPIHGLPAVLVKSSAWLESEFSHHNRNGDSVVRPVLSCPVLLLTVLPTLLLLTVLLTVLLLTVFLAVLSLTVLLNPQTVRPVLSCAVTTRVSTVTVLLVTVSLTVL